MSSVWYHAEQLLGVTGVYFCNYLPMWIRLFVLVLLYFW